MFVVAQRVNNELESFRVISVFRVVNVITIPVRTPVFKDANQFAVGELFLSDITGNICQSVSFYGSL
ncbi:hypothetical protein D3C73_1587430 [compost metagenome]